ncbi:2-dehydro-3-deoxy-D-gluconate 5-dehydrogenase KduD [Clostridium beijerinckii]|jgi:2-deoxy-D-gluconate 3-dehydrogenase|uniref:2-dehydro-3-deoxy-D-gluconate 5-dehydrogenase KduD n=2 Tax=Clostridium beijerinckii TaxID=1520 RepID=A0AAE2UUD9_CLOBE|nr:2-dehydro-3-deoxy-D-gluconate 5-dehydrogenase KduD [Clostridium beijerinckii]ABR32636.1 2-deoxy-D-gluconate 3-dehydrogenase [Clostridium beijerinckii NCIMB 8052]AIU00683.1 2-deoxy-D-gluconate 3-dehydrogenase [Clostridium beijerinckii ATCC 35702]MBF7807684.1 2-dehydro-3-deoxy-D-gluconate 5-dehydrogenase KduD [Clostridium beijerinckii]NOW88299.1 2-deoxy-D-gluconate 3-dehydrogenase [Clostridium beijerinckii]NRT26132.1 2-deoxy-D-gluconate 3-dehydrogenase [Clostridium beijerinckii]
MSNILHEFSMDFFRLYGKVAIVTGGNTGLGQGYAVALAKAGADLIIPTYDTNWDETRLLIEKEGRSVTFVQADLTKKEDREKVIKIAMEVYGKIDVLVNNAGTIRRAPLLEYKEEDWNAVMDINLNAVYFLSQEVAKIMVNQGSGKIINIASMLAFQGGKFVPPYTASKHGVAGITKAFANELASKNIQINAIAPGYIKTANTAPIRADKERNAEIQGRIPADRWAEPFDLMGAIVFLASRASDYVNGHILAVDGGWLVR